MGHPASPGWGCPIRRSPDHSLLAAPRGLSQPSTSFIGSWCQGIHRTPLLARRLDLSTSPSRQDQRSLQKNPCSGPGYPCVLSVCICSTTLQFFRCVNPEARHKKGPTSVEPPRPRGKSSTLTMRLSTPAYGWSVSPRSSAFARQTTSIARPRIFTISNLHTSAQVLCAFSGGGAEGIRTPDLRRAKAALSQLSYGPWIFPPAARSGPAWNRTRDLSLIRTAL